MSQIVLNEVRIEDLLYDELPVLTHGALQGSVLGPTLFLVHINKLCQLKLNRGSIFSFADDTVLVFISKQWEETYLYAQVSFNRVRYWLAKNMLTLNFTKTKYMVFAIKYNALPSSRAIFAHSCGETPSPSNCGCTVRKG
ncbi:hypothetical protein EVAR_32538_1 [Eumeta japonica]|uniref:Reverse transcriptase domain-containing protein n=1 Tax=Eumeta variegata TaxID=151549 RepID=A0A4C1W912_EUMVA|nr:hypothetical protein EVAR_32538_1 [Eumeta japonica]